MTLRACCGSHIHHAGGFRSGIGQTSPGNQDGIGYITGTHIQNAVVHGNLSRTQRISPGQRHFPRTGKCRLTGERSVARSQRHVRGIVNDQGADAGQSAHPGAALTQHGGCAA